MNRFQSMPDCSPSFESENQLDRLHDLQSSHWSVLTDARFDALYAERVKVLSDNSGRMGLDPRWQIASHAIVLEHLLGGLVTEHAPRSILPGSRKKSRELAEAVKNIVRLVMVDTEIAVSLRFNELRLRHGRELAEQRDNDRSEAATLLGAALTAFAAGDLKARICGDLPEAYRDVAASFNAALETIGASLTSAQQGIGDAETLSARFADIGRSIAERSGQQAEALAETSRALQAMIGNLAENGTRISATETAVSRARDAAVGKRQGKSARRSTPCLTFNNPPSTSAGSSARSTRLLSRPTFSPSTPASRRRVRVKAAAVSPSSHRKSGHSPSVPPTPQGKSRALSAPPRRRSRAVFAW